MCCKGAAAGILDHETCMVRGPDVFVNGLNADTAHGCCGGQNARNGRSRRQEATRGAPKTARTSSQIWPDLPQPRACRASSALATAHHVRIALAPPPRHSALRGVYARAQNTSRTMQNSHRGFHYARARRTERTSRTPGLRKNAELLSDLEELSLVRYFSNSLTYSTHVLSL